METALINGLAWTLILGIWIFVGFGLRHSLRELAGRSSSITSTAAWSRVVSSEGAYA